MHGIAICWQFIFDLKKAFVTQLKRINYHCNINLRSHIVSNCSSLKDVTPITPKVNVVYCTNGSCDKTQFYIVKTKRHLDVIFQEPLSGKS